MMPTRKVDQLGKDVAAAIAAAVLVSIAATIAGCSGNGGVTVDEIQASRTSVDAVEEKITVNTAELHNFPAEPEPPSVPTEPVPTEPAPAGSSTPAEGVFAADVGGAYRIGAGDTLSFRSYDDVTLNDEVIVRYDGFISLPLISDINVLGASRDQATELVRLAYGDYFVDPQISLSIRDVISKYYYVIGDVNQPAQYPYTRPLTLLEAIYNAGGQRINQRSGDSFVGAQGQLVKAFIIRNRGVERRVDEYDLRDIETPGAHNADAPVHPGDMVYVPEGVNLVYILGEVRQPSVRQLTPDMTLLQLLAQVGGFNTPTARLRHVVLLREIDAENTDVMSLNIREMLKGGQDVVLQAGDIIYIPERRLSRLQTFVGQFTGSISPMLSLYGQVYDAWYTNNRFDLLYNNDDFNNASLTGNIVALQQFLRDVQGFTAVTLP